MSQRLLALALMAGLAGCGDDLILSELNELEADDLAGAVLLATFNSTESAPSQQAAGVEGPALVPYTFSASVDTEVACPLGGMVDVSAAVDVAGDTQTQAVEVDYNMTQVHDGCVVMSENDRQFTLYGNPDLTASIEVAHDGAGGVAWEGSVEGRIDWETDGREGSCEVLVTFGGSLQTDERVAGELSGVVCGHEVSRAFSIG